MSLWENLPPLWRGDERDTYAQMDVQVPEIMGGTGLVIKNVEIDAVSRSQLGEKMGHITWWSIWSIGSIGYTCTENHGGNWLACWDEWNRGEGRHLGKSPARGAGWCWW